MRQNLPTILVFLMKKSHIVQIALILGLIGLNVGTFEYLEQRSQHNYEAQLREAWIDSEIEPAAMRSDNIYEIEADATTNLYNAEKKQPVCDVPIQDAEVELSAELLALDIPDGYQDNEFIKIRIDLKNTSNITWYGDSHPCESYAKIRLGNSAAPEGEHVLWNDFNFVGNNWVHNGFKNRVAMDQGVVRPGEKATFSFWTEAPKTQVTKEVEVIKDEKTGEEKKEVSTYDWVYERHTFSPVLGETWIDLDVPVILKRGDLPPKEAAKLKYLNAKLKNYSLADFPGEKNLYITLSDQQGYLRFGDSPFHKYTISSGAWATPTPQGDHWVDHKSKYDERFGEPVRVGGAAPHYRMPYWMGLNTHGRGFSGYGLHEVPFLGASKETSDFYQNGLHHDLGKNVSHGCVRSAPQDAQFLYEFADVGMPVKVRKGTEEEVQNNAIYASVRRSYN